jgi:hypothetical protein
MTERRIKVRALRTGYCHEQRYRAGDVFLLDAPVDAVGEPVLPSWVEPVHDSTPERVTTGQQEINAHRQATRAERFGLRSDDGDV